MIRAQCPCCTLQVTLVDGKLEAHEPVDGHRGRRVGKWCDGSGYTVDQAQRWSALDPDEQRKRVDSPWSGR